MPRTPRGGKTGRPALSTEGTIRKTIVLTPQQAEWLEAQPDGASATIRKLIDEARTNPAD